MFVTLKYAPNALQALRKHFVNTIKICFLLSDIHHCKRSNDFIK